MTIKAIIDYALANDYKEICVTDHVWSASLEGATEWHRPQDIAHISQSKPLPDIPKLSCYFGCEAEFLGGNKLSITQDEFNLFDFIVISVNHMHMHDIVRPSGIITAKDMADLVLTRLHELSEVSLPWKKIGIAHLSGDTMYLEGSVADVLDAMDSLSLMEVFAKFARNGAGIELNAGAFKEWDERKDSFTRFYNIAINADCRFYLASDAHFYENLDGINKNLRKVVEALGLSDNQKYRIAS